MALFGLFGKKSEADVLKRHADRVANKRIQAVDRWEAIQTLARMGTREAVEGLLPRFTFYVDPSITDQDEKDAAFEGVLNAGEVAIEPIWNFMRRAESISWPLKMLDKLCPENAVIARLIELLSEMDVEYERDPQRKIQVLATLEERKDDRIAAAVERFVGDANETVRFNAVGALVAQDNAEVGADALSAALKSEESVRVRARILDAFAAADWDLGARLGDAAPRLPKGYSIDKAGKVRKG